MEASEDGKSDNHNVTYTKDRGTEHYGWFNIPFTHTFDAKLMIENLMTKLENKAVKIRHTWASHRQRRRFIEQNILGCVQYTGDVPLLRLRDLEELDAGVGRCIKHIL